MAEYTSATAAARRFQRFLGRFPFLESWPETEGRLRTPSGLGIDLDAITGKLQVDGDLVIEAIGKKRRDMQ